MFKVLFTELCPGCGGPSEIDMRSEYQASGDIVRCMLCQCTGVTQMDGYEQYCVWNEDICDMCVDRLVRRIKRMVHVE